MNNVLANISNIIIPLFLFYIIATGLAMGKDIYGDFTKGAINGSKTVIKIMPTIIGLMVAVGILRASGFLDFLANILKVVTSSIGIPAEIVPLVLVRMFSSSAAMGLVIDVFKEYGTDSNIGMTASIIMSCTESLVYCMSIYFMAVKVTKTRWTLAGASAATVAGVIASVVLAGMM